MRSSLNGPPPPPPPGDPLKPLPEVWHVADLIGKLVDELLEHSRLSAVETPPNLATYALNRASVRAWIDHLKKLVRNAVSIGGDLVTRDDLAEVARELQTHRLTNYGAMPHVEAAQKMLADLLEKVGDA